MDYITKIETILICNNFRPNGIYQGKEKLRPWSEFLGREN